MANKHTIHVSRKVRPLRLAFLIKPNDKKSLKRIFEINTCIWGGRYNGIVPIFDRTPKWWGRDKFNPSAKEIAQGYVEAFEPDYVVVAHKDLAKKIKFDEDRILQLSDLLHDGEDDHVTYGLNVSTILKEHYEKQFKFKQRHKIEAVLPKTKKSNELFLASLFGAYPESKNHKYFIENYKTVFSPKELEVTSKNLASIFKKRPISPLQIGSSFLDVSRRSWSKDPTIFLIDPSKPSDLIDFWNLRALGWRIFPIPKNWTEDMAAHCKQFVSDNNVPLKGNPHGVMHRTTALKSRHISEDEFKKFTDLIHVEKKEALISQYWHPRIWDGWARDKDHVERCSLSNVEDDIECPVDDGQIIFQNLPPTFDLSRNFHHKPKWANVIELKDFGSRSDSALIFPPTLNGLEKLLNTTLHRKTLTDSEGIVTLVEYTKSKHYWKLPKGFSVFQAWLEEQGLKADMSIPGETTQQLIKALGGPWGTRHIADLKIIKLLDKMAHGLVETANDDEDSSEKPTARSRMESRATWWQLLMEINDSHKAVATRHLDLLIEKGVLRVGLKLECVECKQPNWYSLKDIADKIRCERCLQLFSFPSSTPPKQGWYYRTQGPFSVENYAQGAYSAALALRFLISTVEASASWTPSLNISGPNGLKLECDFAMWRKISKFGNPKTNLVWGECKSFDEFKVKDISRCKQLAEQFPGSILVFSTLRSELHKKEKERLIKLVRWGRKSIGAEKLRAPVLILTASELFSDWGPPNCWKDAGGKFAEYAKNWRQYSNDLDEIASATQELHLGMESYGKWQHEQMNKRSTKKRVKK